MVYNNKISMTNRYYLGGPIWAAKDWIGQLYTLKAKPAQYLHQYASVFNTVEGSSTFYSLPSADMVRRWRSEVPAHFRFTFKFPQAITHQSKLRGTGEATKQFLQIMSPLADRIGQLFLQLPPNFRANDLPILTDYLAQLPRDFEYAVEVRHLDFYTDYTQEQRLNDLLQEYRVNRAVFNTSVLFSYPANDELTKEAQRKKPTMPDRYVATANCPMLRYVGYPTAPPNEPYFVQLAAQVVQWINEGKQPYIYIHSPGDLYVPLLCKRLHELIEAKCPDVGKLPMFPAEQEKQISNNQQLMLFG